MLSPCWEENISVFNSQEQRGLALTALTGVGPDTERRCALENARRQPRMDAQRRHRGRPASGSEAGLVTAKQEELRKFGNTLSSIICNGLRQRRINQAF